jgi:hypothetical protein
MVVDEGVKRLRQRQVLSDEACVRSILAAHVAWREGPQRLSMVGRVQPIVGVTNEELWDICMHSSYHYSSCHSCVYLLSSATHFT